MHSKIRRDVEDTVVNGNKVKTEQKSHEAHAWLATNPNPNPILNSHLLVRRVLFQLI